MEHNEIIQAVREHAEKFEAKNAELARQNAEQAERLLGLEQELAEMKSFGGRRAPTAPASVAGEFLKAPQLQAVRDGATTTGRVAIKAGGVKLLSKAISNTGTGQAGDNAYNVQPERWAGLGNDPRRRLTLLDVLPSLTVSTGSFEYMQLTAAGPIAGVQALEGDVKTEAAVPTTVQTAKIATVAHFVKASRQVIDDAPALEQQLDSLLRYGCLVKLENLVINGTGAGGSINGLLNQATAYAATATDPADIIGQASTELQANGYQPSAVVLNPSDWFAMNSSKATGSGEYLVGSPRDPAPPALWNVPVVLSPSLAAGTALVMDAHQTALLERQEVVVMVSTEDGSNFTTNMVTILSELRAGLAVFSPGAVLSVSLTPTT